MFKKVADKFKAWRETRFLIKHGVSTWKQYHYKYDPHYNVRADTIRQMFFGYPYIAEIRKAGALWSPSGWTYDGLKYLQHWLENDCKGKARATIQRTRPFSYCNRDDEVISDWGINEFARDSLFVAFQDERDYLIFLLKWETA